MWIFCIYCDVHNHGLYTVAEPADQQMPESLRLDRQRSGTHGWYKGTPLAGDPGGTTILEQLHAAATGNEPHIERRRGRIVQETETIQDTDVGRQLRGRVPQRPYLSYRRSSHTPHPPAEPAKNSETGPPARAIVPPATGGLRVEGKLNRQGRSVPRTTRSPLQYWPRKDALAEICRYWAALYCTAIPWAPSTYYCMYVLRMLAPSRLRQMVALLCPPSLRLLRLR
ncbi:hypothetical protein GGR57DRAFT_72313 [Xylariaceae sp. FL1272]|nr:hypothetical protein GGR57DRAFT_72313 [Xylariaceae sp. FL1272]